jgi:hypothetical protein
MWEMIPPKKAVGPSVEERKYRVIKLMGKQFQKYLVPAKNIEIDESAVGFKGKIIFSTYNKKKMKWASDYLC